MIQHYLEYWVHIFKDLLVISESSHSMVRITAYFLINIIIATGRWRHGRRSQQYRIQLLRLR